MALCKGPQNDLGRPLRTTLGSVYIHFCEPSIAWSCKSSHAALQVRNGQLEKEARELRADNAILQEHVQQAKHAAQSGEKVSHNSSAHQHIAPCILPSFLQK